MDEDRLPGQGGSDRDLIATFAEWRSPGGETSEGQIDQILARTRRQVGARDLLTFGLLQTWQAIITLAAALYAALLRKHYRSPNSLGGPGSAIL